MAADMKRRRFTVYDYHRMACAGILEPEERVELIDGEIVEMTPIGDEHLWCVNRLNYLFVTGLGTRAVVSVQNPIRLSEYGEPQPDLTLLRPEASQRRGPPRREDVLLVVEVADTSLQRDRRKMRLYAAAGIPEAWIVNLGSKSIEVYRDPRDGVYHSRTVYQGDAVLSPLAFPDLCLRCDEIAG